MKQIVVISGKGGTGKTVLTASFAALAENAVIADCDVDAADMHLILNPKIIQRHEFRSGKKAVISKEQCQQCGECLTVCRFDAIDDDYQVAPVLCEGCNVCSYICPAEAIKMEENMSGEWFISETRYGQLVHAALGVGEENSGKLVTTVRQNAKRIADEEGKDYVLIDGPPGIGCPVIASITDTDLAVIVTEPTLSGIHDMERVVQVTRHFKVLAKVVINKFNINVVNSEEIRKMCTKQEIEVVAQIPYTKKVSESIIQGVPFVEVGDNSTVRDITDLWDAIK